MPIGRYHIKVITVYALLCAIGSSHLSIVHMLGCRSRWIVLTEYSPTPNMKPPHPQSRVGTPIYHQRKGATHSHKWEPPPTIAERSDPSTVKCSLRPWNHEAHGNMQDSLLLGKSYIIYIQFSLFADFTLLYNQLAHTILSQKISNFEKLFDKKNLKKNC